MSVSSRDRKAVIYAEVEKLRHLLDQKDQQLSSAHAEIERKDQQLRAAHEEIERLRARPQAPRISERSARLKAFATKYRCTARWSGDTIELYSKKRGCWVAVPEGTQP